MNTEPLTLADQLGIEPVGPPRPLKLTAAIAFQAVEVWGIGNDVPMRVIRLDLLAQRCLLRIDREPPGKHKWDLTQAVKIGQRVPFRVEWGEGQQLVVHAEIVGRQRKSVTVRLDTATASIEVQEGEADEA